MATHINIDIPESFKFLFEPHRYKVMYSGRGTGKSENIARVLIIKSIQSKIRILCAREIQKSLKDSVHKQLADIIYTLNLGKYFDITRESIKCIKTGSEFIFTGLATSTVDSIKSYANVDYCWLEEASSISKESLEVLIPTIRKEGSEIWISFNPHLEDDPIYTMFVKNAGYVPDCIVKRLCIKDNPFFRQVLRTEMETMKQLDFDAYCNIWEGECKKYSDSLVFKHKYKSYYFTPKEDIWDGPYFGADFGFAEDPTTLLKIWISDDNKLYIENEAHGK
jgi:phage terminase large subunit